MCWLLSHVNWLCISHFHYVMPKMHFKWRFKNSLAKYWSLKTHDSSNHFYLAYVMCCKNSHSKIPIISQVGPFCPWTLIVYLKIDLLHWPPLKKSNDAPGKYMSNGVCAYKELAVWTLHVEVMASWLWVISEVHWAIIFQPYMGISSSWTFWKGENKIYNFHVEQIFIWSFLGHVNLRSKTFHFWKLPLQVTFYFWQFSPGFIFFILELCNVK